MIGIVIGHGGRGPGSHIFKPEVEELERRGHLVIATDIHVAGPEDPVEEARSFDAAVEVQRQAVDLLVARGATRIGFYGRSLGARLALAARDERVRAAVVAAMGTGIVDVVWDAVNFVTVPGPARLFQQGVHDDGDPQARLDRYAFLEAALG